MTRPCKTDQTAQQFKGRLVFVGLAVHRRLLEDAAGGAVQQRRQVNRTAEVVDGKRLFGVGLFLRLRHLAEVDLIDRLPPAVGRLAGQEIGPQVIDPEAGLGRALVMALPTVLLEERPDTPLVRRRALGGKERTVSAFGRSPAGAIP